MHTWYMMFVMLIQRILISNRDVGYHQMKLAPCDINDRDLQHCNKYKQGQSDLLKIEGYVLQCTTLNKDI